MQVLNSNNLKAQATFFMKVLFIVGAASAFILAVTYINMFKGSTIKERGSAEFKTEVLNTLQKIINDPNCLAAESEDTFQKGSIDINKLKKFVSLYNGTEPNCSRALDFDYNVKVTQYPKEFRLYPGDIVIKTVGMLPFLCSSPRPSNDKFVLIRCNYNPRLCPGVCDACGEFDECWIKDCPSSCGKDPLKGCPYNGSCDVTTCPKGNPPSGICCRYLECPVSACKFIINTHASGHMNCWTGSNCDLSKCVDVGCQRYGGWDHGHCTKGFFETTLPSGGNKEVNLSKKVFDFGVGFGSSGFSPEKARHEEVQLSLPVIINYNDTFSTEGTIEIYAVKGELEVLSGTLEKFCANAQKNPTVSLNLSKKMHISIPVTYGRNHLCMGKSCKIIRCSVPISFENITEEGDYILTLSYNTDKNIIEVKR